MEIARIDTTALDSSADSAGPSSTSERQSASLEHEDPRASEVITPTPIETAPAVIRVTTIPTKEATPENGKVRATPIVSTTQEHIIPRISLRHPLESIQQIRQAIRSGEVVREAIKIHRQKSESLPRIFRLNQEELDQIEEKLDSGLYTQLLRDSAKQTFIAGAIYWPLSWAALVVLVATVPKLGIPLTGYEAIPGLGGVTSLAQIISLIPRAVRNSRDHFDNGRNLSGLLSLLSPLTAFGDINWIFAPLIVNSLKDTNLLKLTTWTLYREIGLRFRNLFAKLRRIIPGRSRSETTTQDITRVSSEHLSFSTNLELSPAKTFAMLEAQHRTNTDVTRAIQAQTVSTQIELEPFLEKGREQVLYVNTLEGERVVIPWTNVRSAGKLPWINEDFFPINTMYITGITLSMSLDQNVCLAIQSQMQRQGFSTLAFDTPTLIGREIARNLARNLGGTHKEIESQCYSCITTRDRALFEDTPYKLRTSLDRVLPEGINKKVLWEWYSARFARTVASSPCQQIYSESEFYYVLSSRAHYKAVVYRNGGTPKQILGFVVATTALDQISWINEQSLTDRIEQLGIPTQNTLYVPCIAVARPRGSEISTLSKLIQALFNKAIELDSHCVAFDFSHNKNSRLPRSIKFATRTKRPQVYDIDSQSYFTIDLK